MFNTAIVNIYNIYNKNTYRGETKDRFFIDRRRDSYNSGESNPNSKYTIDQIHKVCKLLKFSNLNHDDISSYTGVNKQTVSNIASKNNWNEISDQYDISKPIKSIDISLKEKIIKDIINKKSTSDIINELNIGKSNSIYNYIGYYRRKYGK